MTIITERICYKGKIVVKKKFSSDLNLFTFVPNGTMDDHYTFRRDK